MDIFGGFVSLELRFLMYLMLGIAIRQRQQNFNTVNSNDSSNHVMLRTTKPLVKYLHYFNNHELKVSRYTFDCTS